MKIYNISFVILLGLATGLMGQVASPSKGVFALTNATIETVTKGVVKGSLVISNGKITALGPNVAIPAGAKVIDCAGAVIYPGMIDGGTQLGLSEVSSVSLTNDYDEVGELTPQMQALTAVNPNATAIPVTRVDGVTTVIAAPAGGRFPGTAALINLVGYTPDQMYAGFKAVVLNFPTTGGGGRFFDQRTEEERKRDEEKASKRLSEIWDQAVLYHQIDSAATANAANPKPVLNPEMAALLPVVRGQMALMVEVDAADDIKAAIKWVQARKVKKVIFSGCAEGWRVAADLAKANIPVVVGPVIAIPTRSSDRYDRAYANPGLLRKAGVKVALRSNDSENVRNLPFHAGFAAAYGMGKEEALKAVTIVPAEIFGVADRLGSLEVGKNATLFVATGDPFEPKTQILQLFIDGWQVPLDSRHIQLYKEFLQRSPGLDK